MKRIILGVFLSVLTINGFAQSMIGLFGGGGLATANNYDIGMGYGLKYHKEISKQTWLGAMLLSQGYSLYYDNEANAAKHGTGYAGAILRYKSSYIFIAPELVHDLGRKGYIEFFVNAGIGFKMSGYDSLRRWDHSYDSVTVGRFDSLTDVSKNMNSMLIRVGAGFTEYLHIGKGNWWFTITEDFGFLTNSLLAAPLTSPGAQAYMPDKLSPGYISLHIGIAHVKTHR